MSEKSLRIPTNAEAGKPFTWRPSLRIYLTSMNLFLLCLLFPLISFFFLHKQTQFRDAQLVRITQDLQDNLERRSATLAQSVAISAEQAIAGYEFTFLNTLAKNLVENDPEIQYIIIQDIDHRAIAHSESDKISLTLSDPVDLQAASLFKKQFQVTKPPAQAKRPVYFLKWTGTAESTELTNCLIIEAITPLYSGSQLIGMLRCSYSLNRFNREIQQAQNAWEQAMREYKFYLLSLTIAFFLIGVVVALLFTRYLLHSIEVLNQGVRRVAAGDLAHEIIQDDLPIQEFQELSLAFNLMTKRLTTSYQQLDEYSHSLEHKVDDRTQELKEAQDHLLQQAHEAGMAEMAVGILHNIGNAMTPAKVSTNHLLKLLTKSPVRIHLHEIMTIIKNEIEASPAVSPDKRAQMIEIVDLLPKSISEEYNELIDSLTKIRAKHEHIEGIIRLQLRYARLNTEAESVDFNAMVEDSLKMLAEQLEKRAIKIIRDYADIPPIRIEKAKLIQIIINLLKNSYESMDDIKSGENLLLLRTFIENGPPEYVGLSVHDNGKGFSEEEKIKFFTFGFTTKARGSGFGLHSCANYLIAHNGSITAHSAGLGQGAEFIIKLPLERKEDSI
ncbi:MAG: hypothetical protein A2511_17965 [Deltaproteobacteria bacterium RIFOXYD12_FULL_50_9]|nr:MAG: hypothetical protein A2511_17965 [Deltaproteobacteria bacterium RIFOXYD12_FULL_50_9]